MRTRSDAIQPYTQGSSKALTNNVGTEERWRSRSARLWILAALFAVASVYALATAIHDSGRVRRTFQAVVHHAALLVANQATARLDAIAVPALTARYNWQQVGGQRDSSIVDNLARAQHHAVRCNCRETLPISQFFVLDVGTSRIASAQVDSGTSAVPVDVGVLSRVASRFAAQAHPSLIGRARLVLSELPDSIAVTMIAESDSMGQPIRVLGAVGRAAQTVRVLFDVPTVGAHNRDDPAVTENVVRIDSAAVSVATESGVELFRSSATAREVSAKVSVPAFDGLVVEVGVSPRNIRGSILTTIGRSQLALFSALGLCAIVLTVLAATSARREMQLLRTRSDFISGVSHDLRMPLSAVLLAGDSLLAGPDSLSVRQRMLVDTILRESHRVIGLVENVLFFSRSVASTPTVTLRPTAVAAIFDDVCEATELVLAAKHQKLVMDGATDIVVLADQRLVRQALVNFVDNAHKYCDANTTIIFRAQMLDDDRVALCVDDSGPGIPASERQRVLGAYQRLARDQESERTGTGLGLAVAQQIANLCGGRIELAPGEGNAGTSARIILEMHQQLVHVS